MSSEFTEYKCPKCGGRIKKMPSLFNPGETFYFCENKFECNYKTTNTNEIESLDKFSSYKPKTINKEKLQPTQAIHLEAKSSTENGKRTFYKSLIAPRNSLNSEITQNLLKKGFGTFDIEYNFPKHYQKDERLLFVAFLAKKLLLRGDPTFNSPHVEEQLDSLIKNDNSNFINPIILHSQYNQNDCNFVVDSDREKLFLTKVIKPLFGKNWKNHVITQTMLNSLTGSESFDSGQRVDFFLFQNDLKVVVELDGEEHALHRLKDEERDKKLISQGIDVIRFRNIFFDLYPDKCINQLKLRGFKQDEESELNNKSKYFLYSNIVHQIQIMVIQGIIDRRFSNIESFDLFDEYFEVDKEELGEIIELALKDLNVLLNNYCELYGFDFKFYYSYGKKNPIYISFDSSNCPNACVLVKSLLLNQKLLYSPEKTNYFEPKHISSDILTYFLKYIFGFSSFQEGQYEAICRVLTKKDSIVLLPTGSGKSLIYQLSSFLTPGLTVVITPITSLMDDQVNNLKDKGITSSLSIHWASQNNNIEEKMVQMMDSITSLIFISPERMQTEKFRDQTAEMIVSKYVYTVAIDEAHCVSEWGHDFRTAYLNIGKNTRKLFKKDKKTPVLVALTGTASSAVLKDVQRELQIKQYDAIITPKSFDRPEISFIAIDSTVKQKQPIINELLKDVLPYRLGIDAKKIDSKTDNDTCCGIIFCPHVNGRHGVLTQSGFLQESFNGVGVYSGKSPDGYSDEEWESIKTQNAIDFKNNDLNILVATKAFGMGIDKPNIRYTIHYNIPGSIESFYQEAGRAGRDRKKSISVVTFSNLNPLTNDYLLKPTTSIQYIANHINKHRKEDDDVTRILYFHVNSFSGIDEELKVVEYVIDALLPSDKLNPKGFVYLKKQNEDQKRDTFEKAIQRLTVLGVVSDYSVDYASEEYKIIIADFSYQNVIDSYLEYVRGYNEGRVTTERKKVENYRENQLKPFLLSMARTLIEFIYDTIEKGRRRGIREMSSMVAKALEDKEHADAIIRSRILDYLQSSYSKGIEEVLGSIDESIRAIITLFDGYPTEEGEMCGGIRSSNEASALRGEVSRQLESTPDHPGLLFLRSLCECYSEEYNEYLVKSDFESAFEFAVSKYDYSEEQLDKILMYLLYKIYLRNDDLSLDLLEICLLQFRTTELISSFCKKIIESEYDFETIRDKATRILLNIFLKDSDNLLKEIKEC